MPESLFHTKCETCGKKNQQLYERDNKLVCAACRIKYDANNPKKY